MGRVALLDRLPGEDDRVRVERAPVVELHVAAQLEHPLRRLVLADLPRLGEPGDERRGTVAAREVPRDEGLVDLVADEAEALEAVVGLAAAVRDVARGHADPERALRAGSASEGEE